jgi:hypothetical protein
MVGVTRASENRHKQHSDFRHVRRKSISSVKIKKLAQVKVILNSLSIVK